MKPLVGVVMGSRSDWETMRAATSILEQLGVPHEVRVVSQSEREPMTTPTRGFIGAF